MNQIFVTPLISLTVLLLVLILLRVKYPRQTNVILRYQARTHTHTHNQLGFIEDQPPTTSQHRRTTPFQTNLSVSESLQRALEAVRTDPSNPGVRVKMVQSNQPEKTPETPPVERKNRYHRDPVI
jgi:hypothetical protein